MTDSALLAKPVPSRVCSSVAGSCPKKIFWSSSSNVVSWLPGRRKGRKPLKFR